MSKWVKWMQWGQTGMVGHGVMTLADAEKELSKFERKAKELLDQTGADHVVYGVKKYDANGELADVRFYLEPMDDARFEVDVATMKNARVYALHKGTNGGAR